MHKFCFKCHECKKKINLPIFHFLTIANIPTQQETWAKNMGTTSAKTAVELGLNHMFLFFKRAHAVKTVKSLFFQEFWHKALWKPCSSTRL